MVDTSKLRVNPRFENQNLVLVEMRDLLKEQNRLLKRLVEMESEPVKIVVTDETEHGAFTDEKQDD